MVAKSIVEINLAHERDTKGTHVFSTNVADAKIKNVYVSKGTFEGDVAPTAITLAILPCTAEVTSAKG